MDDSRESVVLEDQAIEQGFDLCLADNEVGVRKALYYAFNNGVNVEHPMGNKRHHNVIMDIQGGRMAGIYSITDKGVARAQVIHTVNGNYTKPTGKAGCLDCGGAGYHMQDTVRVPCHCVQIVDKR